MVKLGRKLTLVDSLGNELMHRYVIFGSTKVEDTFDSEHSNLPALYIHHFLQEEVRDGDALHSHVGNIYSFILKGGYIENRNGEIIERKRFSLNAVMQHEKHKIVTCIPSTWTILLRGFVKEKKVKLEMKPCENVCDYCKDTFGQCFKENKEFEHDFIVNDVYEKFAPHFMLCGEETDRIIKVRQRAAKMYKLSATKGEEAQVKEMQRVVSNVEMVERYNEKYGK